MLPHVKRRCLALEPEAFKMFLLPDHLRRAIETIVPKAGTVVIEHSMRATYYSYQCLVVTLYIRDLQCRFYPDRPNRGHGYFEACFESFLRIGIPPVAPRNSRGSCQMLCHRAQRRYLKKANLGGLLPDWTSKPNSIIDLPRSSTLVAPPSSKQTGNTI